MRATVQSRTWELPDLDTEQNLKSSFQGEKGPFAAAAFENKKADLSGRTEKKIQGNGMQGGESKSHSRRKRRND